MLMAHPPSPPLKLSRRERARLEGIARSTSRSYAAVREAKGLLLAADGQSNHAIGSQLGVAATTPAHWREKFEREGVKGVGEVAEGRGRKPTIPQERIDQMIDDTRNTTPDDATHWSLRSMSRHSGLSTGLIAQEWKARGLKPHLVKTFKISNDPNFENKLVDVVGLYMHPPKNALVFSVDEKSQIQALDRTQQSLPMKEGKPGTITHDYKRHGTTTLFAALNVLTGEVIGRCLPRHRNEEFLAFLKLIDKETPKGKQVHVIVDNYATHKHENVTNWLEKHKRFHLHFTPTSSSWLNLVERWFREITDKAIRRGVFGSVDQLIETIENYIDHNNADPKPFIWTKTAGQIIAKVRRGRVALESANETSVI